jgi:ferric-dicitrate binding protein FerR (iron transport regulator)
MHLKPGSVIVNAVEQKTGRLYVQTNDCTVSVVGTVFLVETAPDGSRVASFKERCMCNRAPR